MENQAQQTQILFEIAMSIGKSMDLSEMLKISMLTYLRKLNCVSGIVYQTNNINKHNQSPEIVFSIPFTLKIKDKYPEIDNLILKNSSKEKIDSFSLTLPITGKTDENQYFHILPLKGFGILVLVKNRNKLDNNILLSLLEINDKLAQSCVACDNNSSLIESEKKYRDFIANMSHEIRTPMNAILGFSEALYHKLGSKKNKLMVKSVLNSGNHLLSLLNDILDLSKIDAGKLEISSHPVDLKSIILEIQMLFSDKATKKGIVINSNFENNFPNEINLDEIRIKQVIFNLVGNAIKFTHKGFVNIKTSFKNTKADTGTLTIIVEDSGIGIPKDRQEIIFDEFKQESEQSSRLYGGVGLGLSISRRLIHKMGGDISVSSIVNKGTTFTITLTDLIISSGERIIQKSNNSSLSIAFEKTTILVIDDISSNIETVENLLSAYDIVVSSAKNGNIALEILNHFKPDLILLDIRMPGIDGYETSKRIKENPTTAHIPILAFTASVFSSEKIESSTSFDGFLYKPIQKSELISLLSKFLKHRILTNKPILEIEEKKYDEDYSDINLTNTDEFFSSLDNKFFPMWTSINDQLILYKIEEFANDLKKFSVNKKIKILVDYSNRILNELEIVDLEAISKSLKEFPSIIQKLKSLKK